MCKDGKREGSWLSSGPSWSWHRYCCRLKKAEKDSVLGGVSDRPFTMTLTLTTMCTRRADPVVGAEKKPTQAERAQPLDRGKEMQHITY